MFKSLRCITLLWLLSLIFPQGICQHLSDKDSTRVVRMDFIALANYLSKPDHSIRTATQTLQSAIEMKSRYLEGMSYYILSKAHWAKANYYLSTEYGFKALKIFENTRHTKLWTECLISLARTSIDLQHYDQAKKFLDQAMVLGKRTMDEKLLGEVYRETSMLLSEQKQYDSALFYSNAGIAIFEKYSDSLNASILYSRKAKIFFNLGQYRKSSLFNSKSLLYDSLVGNRRALGISYYQSALNLIRLNNLDSAVVLLKRSIRTLNEIKNMLVLVKVHDLLADVYLQQNKPALAAGELKLVVQYKDSLYNSKKNEQILEMQSLYELSSKERTIQMLASENMLRQHQVQNQRLFLAFLSAFILLLVVLVFSLTRLRRIQKKTNADLATKNAAIERQKEEISVQANSLQELNQLKSKLFSVISHDLRGPIASLHSMLDLVTRKKLSPNEFTIFSDKLKGNLNITQRTLENLLNWSLSQMEGIKTEPRSINVKNMLDEACHLMTEQAQRKNITLENESLDIIYVKADADQLQLILRNLIHNAIKFSKPADRVVVSALKNTDSCKISVLDFGIGMTASEIETIVDSKNHFSKIGTHQEKGTGLGLLLCKEFIKRNGGSLQIISGINKGTEVAFTLPITME